MNDAYAAYQQGQLDKAEQLYNQAATRQRSTDALLGLAAIAATRNRESDAVHLYSEVLELDPRNAAAQAALLDLLGNTDSQATESRLEDADRARIPSRSCTRRWATSTPTSSAGSDAQAAYFEAWRGAPNNADYAFNLAVSLDQLQPGTRQRSTYYEKALSPSSGAHRFDRALAEDAHPPAQAGALKRDPATTKRWNDARNSAWARTWCAQGLITLDQLRIGLKEQKGHRPTDRPPVGGAWAS
jgi:tetratricopeptide (TPR) repeat protein